MKKINKNYLIIGISSLALFIVMIIQFTWIIQTAKVKEELFNEKANMVLSRTTEALCKDKATCMRIGACMEMDDDKTINASINKNDKATIDSILNHYMDYYNFHVDYTFIFAKHKLEDSHHNNKALMSNTFYKSMDELSNISGLQLKLVIPDKQQFILAEMGPLFVTSIILIIIVIVMFWRTIISLLKEKEIAEHTTEFLNNMTHEFKTPLTNIALAGKMILKDHQVAENPKTKQYSEIILEENEKLRTQVENVLNMSALERGEMNLKKEILDVHQLIQEIVKCMNVQIEEHQGQINLELLALSANVNADKSHLSNAICNILENSIKYNKGNLAIKIQTYNKDNKVFISIDDNGIGIDKEHQKSIFNKYYRVPTGNVHNVKGFGLGLAYVKKIVELHEGILSVQSELGKGTTIQMSLPNA